MAKASWPESHRESNATVVFEGNRYFPPKVSKRIPEAQQLHNCCPWKGSARYFHVAVDGMQNENQLGTTRTEAAARKSRDASLFGMASTSRTDLGPISLSHF